MTSVFEVTRVGSFVPRCTVNQARSGVVIRVDPSISSTLDRKINTASSAHTYSRRTAGSQRFGSCLSFVSIHEVLLGSGDVVIIICDRQGWFAEART
jgi:hypothetical protein